MEKTSSIFKIAFLCAALLVDGCFIPAVAKVKESTSKTSLNSLERPENSGWALGIESSSYISLKNHPDSDRNPYGFSLGVDRIYTFSKFDFEISGESFFSTNQPLLSYNHIDELNFHVERLWGASEIDFGRARKDWSTSDSFWRMGTWQPLFLWNYLKPEEQGLTGAFFKWKTANTTFDLLASPFFIPSQGPSYFMRDGQFESANPWFSIPVGQLLMGSGSSNIRYRIHTPDAGSIIMNPGIAMRFQTNRSDNSWWSVSSAVKPSNQLAMGLKGSFNLRSLELDVDLFPFVLYHTVATAEYGKHLANSDFILSVTGEWPNAVSVPNEQSAYQPGRSVIVSPMWLYFLNRKSTVTAAYLYREVQGFSHVGDFDLAVAASGMDRYFFKNAMSLAYQGPVLMALPLNFTLRSAYDFDHRGILLTGEVNYKIASRWNFAMGMETLGVDDESGSTYRNPFMQFRSNDRVYGGLSYVF